MLNNVIDKISNDFIKEAISSPNLLADMAAMEKYMAESYSSRIFIELLQNADDCGSKQVYIEKFENDIIFVNDGKPFDENDVLSIKAVLHKMAFYFHQNKKDWKNNPLILSIMYYYSIFIPAKSISKSS